MFRLLIPVYSRIDVTRYSVRLVLLVVMLVLAVTRSVEAGQVTTNDPDTTAQSLDLETLKSRLRTTPALSLTEKLALKQEVGQLLDQLRLYHSGRSAISLEALHRQFDQLVSGLVSVLHIGDPALCQDILQAQEAIWGVLRDPLQFARL